MSYNLIPVLTVDDKKYNQPTQNKGGLYVVNKGVLQDAPSNKFYLYDQNSGKYYNVNEQTVSEDLLKQFTEYEQRLNNIGRITADTANPTQINSFADIVSMMSFKLPVTVVGNKIYSNPDVILKNTAALGAAKEYVEDMLINPVISDELSGKEKAVTVLNNFLVNLGETMDYFTGANAVKALLQGKDVSEGYKWNAETGRAQYDWNVETGAGGLVDFGTNFFLELISDPTNWITFGGKQAVKDIITSTVDDVASSMGLTANKQYIKGITKGLTEEFGTTDTLKNIDYRRLFNLANDVDNNTVLNISKALNASLEARKAEKHISLVNSVMGTSDYIEKTAFKTAMMSSTLGLEAMAVKGGTKYAMPWVKNKLGNILKYNGTNGEYKWSDYEKIYRDAEDAYTVYNLITKSYEHLPKEAAEHATRKVREDILRGIQNTVDTSKSNLDKTVSDLDELAKSKGFGGINDMYDYFVTIRDNVDGSVSPIVRKLDGIIRDVRIKELESNASFLNAVSDLMNKAARFTELDLDRMYYESPVKELLSNSQQLDNIVNSIDKLELSWANTSLIKDTARMLKYHNVVTGLEYLITVVDNMSRVDLNSVVTLRKELESLAKTIGIDINVRRVNLYDVAFAERVVDITDMDSSIRAAIEDVTSVIDNLLLLGGKDTSTVDYLMDAIDHITALTNGIKATHTWYEKIDSINSMISKLKEAIDEEAATVSDFIDLTGHKTAPIFEEYRAKDNMLASTALKEQLEKATKGTPNVVSDTKDAFIHPADFKQLDNVRLDITVDDCLPNTQYTLEQLGQYLISTLNKMSQIGYIVTDDAVEVLHDINSDVVDVQRIFENIIDGKLSISVNDIEELIVILRRRAKQITSEVTEESVERVVEKEIPKSFIKKVWSGEWSEETFKTRTGVDYNKVYTNVNNGKWYVKITSTPTITVSSIGDAHLFESVADNLADYIDAICIEQYGKMFVDAKQLYSKLYAVKLSQAASLNMLLNDDSITKLLNSILDCREGAGAFIRTLEQYEDTAWAAETLHALAESTYVYGELINSFRGSEFITDEWADALTDSLAGIMRMHISDVHLDDLTMDLLDSSRLFINKSNSTLPNVAKYIDHEFLPEKQADVLADVLFNKNVHRFSPDASEFYVDLIDKLNKGKEYNVVFSIGQHSKKAGVFEFVCELPEEIAGYGKKIHFVNDSVDYKSWYADPRYAEEMLDTKKPYIIRGEYAPNAVHFDSTDKFVAAINDFLETLKTHVNPPEINADEFRDIQFLGFGNSVSYNNQNKVLRDFFRSNEIKFSLNNHIQSRRNAKCVDVKELIHLDSGATTITDELYNAVHRALEVSKNELDAWNSRTSSARAYIMPDLSRDVLNAIDTITTEVDNARSVKESVKKGGLTPDVSDTTASLMAYSEDVLDRFSSELRSFSSSLNSNLKTVRESNATYASELIVAKVFNELTGEPNIMKYVTKYLVDNSNGGLPELSLKIYHDPDLVASWYDLKIFEGKNVNDLLKVNDLLRRLQNTSDKIARAELLYAPSSMAACDEVIETLRNVLEQHSTSTYTRRNISYIDTMHKSLMPEQSYAIAVYYMKEFNKLPEKIKEAVHKMTVAKWENNLDAQSYWGLVKDSENTVLNSRMGVYVPEINSFKSMKFDESYDSVYHALKTREEIIHSKHNVDCFADSLRLQDEIMSKHNVNSPVYKMQRSMIEAYGRFIDTVTSFFDGARNNSLVDMNSTDDAVKQYEHKLMYTKRIETYQNQLNEIAEYHARTRAYNILNMDIETYEQYLFKYSQGIQLFDTSSKVLRNEEFTKDLLKRIEFLNSADNKTSLRTVQNGKYIIVYVDKDSVDAKYLERLRRTATGYEEDGKYIPAINMHFNAVPEYLKDGLEENLFFKDYMRIQEEIEHTHNVAYSLSTHRAMNDKKLKELYSNLPEEFANKLLDVDYWASAGLVQGGLVHNVVGDYSSGLGDLFTTYSGNLITNINSGFSKLYKQGVSREAYVTLFTSPINSLKSRVEMVNSYLNTTLTAKEVHEAVVEMGYKVASFTGKEVKLFDVSTEKGFREALDKGAILIDSGLYDKVFRTMMNNDLPHKLTSNWLFSYMHLLKLGQLQSPGWIMRNVIDSTVKGAIASNANVYGYVTMIPTVIRKLKAFDELVSAVYDSEKSLSEFSIKKFFKKNPEQSMSLEEFLDYYTFSKNSASVPTPAQLNILNNVEQNLLKLFPEESSIKDVHIRSLLKEYVDHDGNYKLTKAALEQTYDDNIVTSLMNVFNRIPKGHGKIKDTNLFSKAATWLTDRSPLMKANNTVERMERFLAYGYNRMMGKTTGAAIDVVNTSQFNRAYDTVRKRMLEVLMPFSAFQVDNLMFWVNTFSNASGSVTGVLADYLQAYQNEEELTPEEIATNASVQYMFLQGNIMLDDDGSLTLKTSDSLFNTMSVLADPIGYLSGAFNVPLEKVAELVKALTQDVEEYKENPYGKTMPISLWTDANYEEYAKENGLHSFFIDFIPVFGAWWLRAQTSWEEGFTTKGDVALRQIAPSIFGRVKRTGYDWYGANNNEEYHKTHTFVAGISYVPKWLTKDPRTYVNTIQRLINMGYDEEIARKMVVDWGYYMKAPDYVLKQFKPYQTYIPKAYPKRAYAPKPIYTRKVYPKKGYVKPFKMISGGDRYRTTRFGVARIYRLTSMYDRITKSGTSRMTMMLGRGHGASSIRVVRDRIKNNNIRRQRQRRILRM